MVAIVIALGLGLYTHFREPFARSTGFQELGLLNWHLWETCWYENQLKYCLNLQIKNLLMYSRCQHDSDATTCVWLVDVNVKLLM